MSKNKYILPFKGKWYIEYGGTRKKNSHSWDIIPQRYAYDFEIRKNNLPYHDDYKNKENYYCYNEDIIAPCDGYVYDIVDLYKDTRIIEGRPVICDIKDVRGNYITIKHAHGEYSTICHIKKGTFKVKEGDYVKAGTVLASVGNSGNTMGPHIHFQVQKGPDFDIDPGIKITFKSVKSGIITKKYLNNGIYVKNNIDL